MSIDMKPLIQPKSDQLNAEDLKSGPMTVLITGITKTGDEKQPVALFHNGTIARPWKPCKNMRRVLVAAWGDKGEVFVGRSVTLYFEPSVRFGGRAVGGIRVSHCSHIENTIEIWLAESKGYDVKHVIQPLVLKPTVPSDLDQRANEAAAGGIQSYRDFFTRCTEAERKAILPGHEKRKANAQVADDARAAAKPEQPKHPEFDECYFNPDTGEVS